MAKRKCNSWLKTYMDFSAHSEAPDKFHFWTGVSVIAGALRRKVWIDMGYFQWVPNFYIIFVAPPGVVSKSTTVGIGMKLLKQVPEIRFGPSSATWQAFVQALAESGELYPMDGGDYFPMSCLTVEASEIGTFLKPHDMEMVDTLVSLWDGQVGNFTRHTKTSGRDNVENPWVNIIGCTTPAWISGNFPEYMIGGGFTSRCIFVFADEKRNFVAYPSQHMPPEWVRMEQQLLHDLELIAEMKGPFSLTQDALAWGTEWYEKHHKEEKPSELNNDRFQGYLARKQTHMHKLAMILSASNRSDMTISVDELNMADKFVTALEKDMPKIFGRIGQTADTLNANQVVQLVWAFGKIEKSKLQRMTFSQMSAQEFLNSIGAAVSAGYIIQVQHGNELYLQPGHVRPGEFTARTPG